jgi:hypothetical protein
MPKSEKRRKAKHRSRSKAIKKPPRSQAPRHRLKIDGARIGSALTQLRRLCEAALPVSRELLETEFDQIIALNVTTETFCHLLQTCPKFTKGLVCEGEATFFLKAVTLLRDHQADHRDKLPHGMRRYWHTRAAMDLSKNGLLAVEPNQLREVILGGARSEHSREEWIDLITGAIAAQHAVLENVLMNSLAVVMNKLLHDCQETVARASLIVGELMDLATGDTVDRR